jgi:hypothetical protein
VSSQPTGISILDPWGDDFSAVGDPAFKLNKNLFDSRGPWIVPRSQIAKIYLTIYNGQLPQM